MNRLSTVLILAAFLVLPFALAGIAFNGLDLLGALLSLAAVAVEMVAAARRVRP